MAGYTDFWDLQKADSSGLLCRDAPIDGGAALASASGVSRLHDEVLLDVVEQHVVVVLDPAPSTAMAQASGHMPLSGHMCVTTARRALCTLEADK